MVSRALERHGEKVTLYPAVGSVTHTWGVLRVDTQDVLLGDLDVRQRIATLALPGEDVAESRLRVEDRVVVGTRELSVEAVDNDGPLAAVTVSEVG